VKEMATLLVAYDENGVIGNEGQIPWHLPGDLAQFKKRTMGQAVIMGRKTWDSLPEKPLPARLNIVLTRNPEKFLESHELSEELAVLDNITDAIDEAEQRDKHPYIIGGAQIYEEAWKHGLVDTIIATEVEGTHEGDTHFPLLEEGHAWMCTTLEEHEGFQIVEHKHFDAVADEVWDLREEVVRLKKALRKARAQLASYTRQAGRRFRDESDYVQYHDEEYER